MNTMTAENRISEVHVGEHAQGGTLVRAVTPAPRGRPGRWPAKRVHCVVVESGRGEVGPLWGVVSGLDLVAAANVRGLDEQTAGGSAASPMVMVSPARRSSALRS